MLLLLPPSEGKTGGGDGPSLRKQLAGAAAQASLAGTRLRAARALAELAQGPPQAAAQALLLPPGVRDEALAANARVLDSPTAPALGRYAGVVYDGLAAHRLPPASAQAAQDSVLIFSGLLGVVQAHETIPWYRLPAKAALPGFGVAAAAWRPVLVPVMTQLLDASPGCLVLDLRSSDYAAMWRPTAAQRARVLQVRVLTQRPDGTSSVVSFDSKLAKGRLAHALLRRLARMGRPRRRELGLRDIGAAWSSVEPAGRLEIRATGSGTVLDLTRPSTVLSPRTAPGGSRPESAR